MNDVIMVPHFCSVKSENTLIDKLNRTHGNVIQMSQKIEKMLSSKLFHEDLKTFN